MDFFREWHPTASGQTEVLVGRIATGVIVVLGICWVLVIKSLHSDLYVYLQSVQGYLSPAIATLFLLGVFWKRATAPAALCAFIVGTIAGLGRLAADLIMRNEGAAVSSLKQQLYHGTINAAQYAVLISPIRERHPLIFDFWNVNWLYFAQGSLIVTALLLVIISLATPPPDAAVLKYTWYGATPDETAATRASWGTVDVVLSGVVLLATVMFYIAFW
jgi:solute:Na+ symporter, SSS family